LKLSTEKQNEVTILNVGGRLDAGGAPELEAQGRGLIQGGAKRLLLDLAGVEYVSSAGLRSLLVLAKTAKAAGSALALCCLTAAVREVMTISGFDNILSLAADRTAAMNLLK
jgi:anti-anti-sigma factor